MTDLQTRIVRLGELLGLLAPIPASWLEGRTAAAKKHGGTELRLLPCRDWRTLVQAFHKSVKVTEGMEGALWFMLTIVASTDLVGDAPCWGLVLSPPSCLDANTPIADPVDNTTKTVLQRYEEGRRFFVWTKKADGTVGVAQALPPARYPKTSMYQLTFESGKQITVTAGHRFWNGTDYVSLAELLQKSDACRLPSISDTDLSVRRGDVRRSTKTAQGSQSRCLPCSCPCGGPPPRAPDNDRDAFPSPNGVPECNRCCSCGGGSVVPSPECTRAYRTSDHPSTSSDDHQRTERMRGGQYLACAGGTSLSSSTCETHDSSQQPSLRPHKKPPTGQHLQGTSGTPVEHPSVSVQPQPWLWSSLGLRQPAAVSDASRKSARTASSSPPATLALSGGEVSFQPPTTASSGDRCYRSSQTPHCRSDRTGRVQRPCPMSHGPMPCAPPIDSCNVLGDPITIAHTDRLIKSEYVGERHYYDFCVPETNNYIVQGFVNHNTGKTLVCEAVSVNRKYVIPKDSMTGLFSGVVDPNEPDKDQSLAADMKGKTLAVKELASMLDHPCLPQILSQLRSLYDRSFRPYFKRGPKREYDMNATVVACGTSRARELDASEMGDRFLKFSIMDEIDEELEDEVSIRAADSADAEMRALADGKPETRDSPESVHFKRLCGGYVGYLRENVLSLLPVLPEEYKTECRKLGKFIAIMRARPSKKQTEDVQREMSPRLVKQLVRLAVCGGAVLGVREVDERTMRRVRKVVMDTARGRTLKIVRCLWEAGSVGLRLSELADRTKEDGHSEHKFLKFLSKIHAVSVYSKQSKSGHQSIHRWHLTPAMMRLCNDVLEPAAEE